MQIIITFLTFSEILKCWTRKRKIENFEYLVDDKKGILGEMHNIFQNFIRTLF